MSVETIESMDVAIAKRAWRVEFHTPKAGPYTVVAHQEETKTRVGESVPFAKTNKGKVERQLTAMDENGVYLPTSVMAETVTLQGGQVISLAQIMEAGSLFSDKWRAEDEGA